MVLHAFLSWGAFEQKQFVTKLSFVPKIIYWAKNNFLFNFFLFHFLNCTGKKYPPKIFTQLFSNFLPQIILCWKLSTMEMKFPLKKFPLHSKFFFLKIPKISPPTSSQDGPKGSPMPITWDKYQGPWISSLLYFVPVQSHKSTDLFRHCCASHLHQFTDLWTASRQSLYFSAGWEHGAPKT